MDAAAIDQLRLNFNPQGLLALNAVIGLMMFGMALDIKTEDFKRIFRAPKAPVIGLLTQFILLPAFTFLLTLIMRPMIPTPSMALGMILIAACPGGNLSNVITYLARGNTAVSVSMTAISSAAAIIMTPLNLHIWGSLNSVTAPILKQVHLEPFQVFQTIFIILGIPLAAGILVSRIWPNFVEKIRKPFKIVSVVIFCGVVLSALGANWHNFLQAIGLVVFAVFIHNALALSLGYSSGRISKLSSRDVRAVTIEVGIQNSALGLTLIFNFFGGLGGMAIIGGWWGIWHIISGLTVAFFWSHTKLNDQANTQ